jgi:hypothetical protein
MEIDIKAFELSKPILRYFNALCKSESFPPLPCIEAHSKRGLKRSLGYIATQIKHFKQTPQRDILEGLIKIASDYCDTP